MKFKTNPLTCCSFDCTQVFKSFAWIAILMWSMSTDLSAQIVINEMLAPGTVEIKNQGSSTVNVGSYWLCDFPAYAEISSLNVVSGSMNLGPGEILVIDGFNQVAENDGEMGLYTSNAFGSSTALIDYVEWGSTGHQRSTVAVAAGIWTTGDFVPAFPTGESLEYDGEGDASTDWTPTATPTIGEENSNAGGGSTCMVTGGTVSGGPFTFCIDGVPDMVSGVAVTGNSGTNTQWIVTDANGTILGLPPTPDAVNFDEAGAGTCLIYSISYDDGLVGLEVDADIANLDGCFELSNAVTVNRNEAVGGTVVGGPFEFCIDGLPDMVSGVSVSGNIGANSQWLVADPNGMILGLPPTPEAVNFDDAGVGVCLIYSISYEDGLTGLAMGSNISDLSGCFELSNAAEVNRVDDGPTCAQNCIADAGVVTGGPFVFCVDGIPDMVSGVAVSGNIGANSQWVVADPSGLILGLPPTPEAVDFDQAGAGTCLIYSISFETGLNGLDMGSNIFDLDGCFDISNSVEVLRVEDGPACAGNCPAQGGTLDGGPFRFCVDGEADFVSGITLSGNAGANSAWVITDADGLILGLPPMPGVVNFDDAGPGACFIYNISYEDGLVGLAMDGKLENLEGCFELSNSVEVVRTQFSGGVLEGGPFQFCIDGEADFVSGITRTGDSGTTSQWVVTDPNGMILGLPPMPGAVNFDEAGTGICLIYSVSYGTDIGGLEAGANINNLDGCHDISNAISVVRTSGGAACDEECEVESGLVTGDTFEFCVDGEPDMVSGIELSGNSGPNNQWVVTDAAGSILGLPPMPGAVNFDEAGAGVCMIVHVSYEDGLEGLAPESNLFSGLSGCYSISNPIIVTRTEANGGTLEGGPFEFCVDGEADFVSGITLSGTVGDSVQWVITDEEGMILGLPPMPGVVNFDEAGAGVCLIYNLSYLTGLSGLEAGANIADLEGCHSFSNAVTVTRVTEGPACGDCTAEGGMLEGGPFTFCVDGEPDMVSGITLSGNTGMNSQWVIADTDGNILGLPPMPGVVNFDDAGAGVCLIYNVSYEDGLTGLEADANLNELEGCFSISNSVMVTRVTDGPACETGVCEAVGGTLEGGPFSFCVDGMPDMVSGVTLSGNTGMNSQWVVADPDGNILGLPPMPSAVDFDAAGAGVCLIYNVSYEDGLTGLEAGENLENLDGCFDISNAIEVVRNQPAGGTLEGGPFTFCVDGEPDFVSGITLGGNTGGNSQWVVTDDMGMILGLPPMPSAVNFDEAGAGTCLIYNVSFETGLSGLEAGANINELEGCHDLSNSIAVMRVTDGSVCDPGNCNASGGALEGGPFEFCVDGEPDMVSGITLSGNTGMNNQWVVTDHVGNILGLPPMPGVVNFDDAGVGLCLIWNVAYDDGVVGLEAGQNVFSMQGCYDFSNHIRVTRRTDGAVCATACENEGGTLEGGPFNFCVDGMPDMVSGVTLSGNTGTNNQWVVTDNVGNILGLPPTPEAVNFDDAGPGVCLIWNIAYEDGLVGLEAGENIFSLAGCHDFSNHIRVVREINGPACVTPCNNDGGIVEGGPFTFCVDGEPDMVSGVSVSGNSGTNSQWVVTDNNGNILGLPPSPEVVNFDDAGTGVCLIWHLSYEDDLQGLEAGLNIFNLLGCRDFSNHIRVVRISDGDDCNEPAPSELISGINIYPNPASNYVTVEFDNHNTTVSGKVSLVDALGKIVASKQISGGQEQVYFDLQSTPSGIYFVNFTVAEQSITKKIIVTGQQSLGF